MVKITLHGETRDPIQVETLEIHREETGVFYIRCITKEGKVYDTGLLLEMS